MISEVKDPSSVLVMEPAPAYDIGSELRKAAGPVLGSVDWLAAKALGISPLKALCDPVIGDFAQLDSVIVVWRNAERANLAISENFSGLAGQVGPYWHGGAADSFRARIASISGTVREYADGCGAMAEITQVLRELCLEAAEVLMTALSFIGDFFARAAAKLAVPVLGWVSAGVDALGSVKPAMDMLNRGLRAIEGIVTAIERFRDVLAALTRLTNAARLVAEGAATFNRIRIANVAPAVAATSFGAAP